MAHFSSRFAGKISICFQRALQPLQMLNLFWQFRGSDFAFPQLDTGSTPSSFSGHQTKQLEQACSKPNDERPF